MSERHIITVTSGGHINGVPGYFRTKCSCSWESIVHTNRPEAIREHAVHAHGYRVSEVRR